MKKFTNKILVMALAIVATTAFVSCGKDNPDPIEDEKEKILEQVEKIKADFTTSNTEWKIVRVADQNNNNVFIDVDQCVKDEVFHFNADNITIITSMYCTNTGQEDSNTYNLVMGSSFQGNDQYLQFMTTIPSLEIYSQHVFSLVNYQFEDGAGRFDLILLSSDHPYSGHTFSFRNF